MYSLIKISSQQQLLDELASNELNIILINYETVHNLGIVLLKQTIAYHNIHNKNIIFDVNVSYSYAMLCIDEKVPFVLYNDNNPYVYTNQKEIFNFNGCIIFQNTKKIIEYFGLFE